jgi:RHS repeat-associated protein
LQQLQIADSANSADAQTCTYAHDDLARISGVNCGSIWAQTYSYDPFGNITTTGMFSWMPGYDASNRYTLSGTTYDSNGNLLNDTFHTYTWDGENKVATIVQNATTFGFVYDALGRVVEYQANGAATSELARFGPFKISMIGQASAATEIPVLNGISEIILPNGALSTFRMADWLGSPRLAFSYTGGGFSQSMAYSPFGQPYASPGSFEANFTGQPNSVCDGCTDSRVEYDFPARELHPIQGRWISPDPAGLNAVDMTTPQSWNRYAYVNNDPLSYVDPTGLQYQCPTPSAAICQGGSYLGTSYLFNFVNYYDEFSAIPNYQWVPGSASQPAQIGTDPGGNPIYGMSSSTGYWKLTGVQITQTSGGGNRWWGTFGSTFVNGVLHGVRKPGQSFKDCVLQNANQTTGGAFGKLTTAAAALVPFAAAASTGLGYKAASTVAIEVGARISVATGSIETGEAVASALFLGIHNGVLAAGYGGAVLGGAALGTGIGSAINCR